MMEQGVDTLVMGCTHFPFVIPLIKQISGQGMRVIDPAPAVARQVERVLEQHELLNLQQRPGTIRYFTSGDPQRLANLLPKLTGDEAAVKGLTWQGDQLQLRPDA
jgi:glutamate racemase